jgi:mannose-6-phosphate isomerase-like protein (cupin superfamily)
MRIIEGAGVWARSAAAAGDWTEQLRTPDLSVGTYCIPAGGLDTQNPHSEDEIYVVIAGRAKIVTPAGAAEVEPGSVIFVPAGEERTARASPRSQPHGPRSAPRLCARISRC